MTTLDERLSRLVGAEGRIARLEEEVGRLPSSSGGESGPPGGISEDWKTSVDTQLARLHADLRQQTGWLIAGLIAPFLAIIGLYVYVGSQANAIEVRIVGVEKTIAEMKVEQAKTNGKIDVLLDRKRGVSGN